MHLAACNSYRIDLLFSPKVSKISGPYSSSSPALNSSGAIEWKMLVKRDVRRPLLSGVKGALSMHLLSGRGQSRCCREVGWGEILQEPGTNQVLAELGTG